MDAGLFSNMIIPEKLIRCKTLKICIVKQNLTHSFSLIRENINREYIKSLEITLLCDRTAVKEEYDDLSIINEILELFPNLKN